jgi:hypothetical protein
MKRAPFSTFAGSKLDIRQRRKLVEYWEEVLEVPLQTVYDYVRIRRNGQLVFVDSIWRGHQVQYYKALCLIVQPPRYDQLPRKFGRKLRKQIENAQAEANIARQAAIDRTWGKLMLYPLA